jgi:hypothetical protein
MKPFLDRNPVLLNRIALFCVKELYKHKLRSTDMAIMGGKAIDHYRGTDESKDTDVEVYPTNDSVLHEDIVVHIVIILYELCSAVEWFCHEKKLALPFEFPINPEDSTLLPAAIKLSDPDSHLAARLRTADGTLLRVTPTFPFCIFVLFGAGLGTHTLIQLRSRVQEGVIGRYPRYPGFLEIAVKQREPYFAHNPYIVPYLDATLPYINPLSLVRSQLLLIRNLPEGDNKAEKTRRLQAVWPILRGILTATELTDERDALVRESGGILVANTATAAAQRRGTRKSRNNSRSNSRSRRTLRKSH